VVKGKGVELDSANGDLPKVDVRVDISSQVANDTKEMLNGLVAQQGEGAVDTEFALTFVLNC